MAKTEVFGVVEETCWGGYCRLGRSLGLKNHGVKCWNIPFEVFVLTCAIYLEELVYIEKAPETPWEEEGTEKSLHYRPWIHQPSGREGEVFSVNKPVSYVGIVALPMTSLLILYPSVCPVCSISVWAAPPVIRIGGWAGTDREEKGVGFEGRGPHILISSSSSPALRLFRTIVPAQRCESDLNAPWVCGVRWVSLLMCVHLRVCSVVLFQCCQTSLS